MVTKPPVQEEVLKLADECNELCVAVETIRIAYPGILSDYAGKILIQRKDTAWERLKKFGY